ncbi:ribonuclease H-like domain-containing protein, partial [Tanacetum coccineum]
TLSKTLQARLVVEDPQTAKEAWDLIADIFNDNKRTRLGSPISNDDVVTIALEGLPDKYDSVSGIIVHRETFSNIKTVRSMLTTKEMRTRRSNVASDKVNKPGFNFNKGFCHFGEHSQYGYTGTNGMGQSTIPSSIAPSMPNVNVNLMTMHTGHTGYAQPVSHYIGPPGFSSPMYGSTQIVEFDAFGFPVKDFMIRRVLLRCDSTVNFYQVTKPSTIPHDFLTSQYTRYKARLVANGSTKLECINVDETFSPVVKSGTIQTVPSLAISRHWQVHQLDIKDALLHGDLSEIIYASALRVSGLCTSFLCLFITEQIIASLHQEFSMTDLDSLNYFLGDSVTHDSLGMFLSHRKYAAKILERAHMVSCNPRRTPIDTEYKLGDDGDLVSDLTLYRSLASSIQYITFTRSDIFYTVQHVCLYMHDHRKPHFLALKQILRYVHGTLYHGLQLFSSSTTSLVAYSDVNWVGCPTTWRLTLGYCVFLGNNLLSRSSKRQTMISRSSVEAEYHGVANVVAETCWLRNLLRELHTYLSSATLIYRDNVSCNPCPFRVLNILI